jgi:hypothetical protein
MHFLIPLVLTASSLAVSQPSYPPSVNLGLVLRPQQADYWCWAASANMIMRHIDPRIDTLSVRQCEQVNKRYELKECCLSPVTETCDVVGWPEFTKYGFKVKRTRKKALTWDELRHELSQGRPVAVSVKNNGNGGGHMMVAYGYYTINGTDMVLIADPWEPNVGVLRPISYAEYKTPHGKQHWDDFFDIRR